MTTILCLILSLIFTTLALANPALEGFTTTDLSTEQELKEAYNLTRKGGGGECFQRAHYWSYSLFRKKGYHTQKTYIFFSARYKRLIQGQWWFHVAPSIKLQGDLYVMDNEFLSRPVTFEAWKNGAMDHGIHYLTNMKKRLDAQKINLKKQLAQAGSNRTRAAYLQTQLDKIRAQEAKYLITDSRILPATAQNWPWSNRKDVIELDCPEITSYSEFKQNGELFHCFIFNASMYYYEPRDMEKLEKQGIRRTEWKNSEVFSAFKSAFGGGFPFTF